MVEEGQILRESIMKLKGKVKSFHWYMFSLMSKLLQDRKPEDKIDTYGPSQKLCFDFSFV